MRVFLHGVSITLNGSLWWEALSASRAESCVCVQPQWSGLRCSPLLLLQQKHETKLTIVEHEESFRNNCKSIYYVINIAKIAYYSNSGFLFSYRVSFLSLMSYFARVSLNIYRIWRSTLHDVLKSISAAYLFKENILLTLSRSCHLVLALITR